jgi:Fe(3+) dicitrate transport protein
VVVSPRLDLATTVWRNDFERAWYKLESVMGTGLAGVLERPGQFPAQYAVLTGGESAAGALVIRNNNREYYSQGVQSTLGFQAGILGSRHKVEVGVRYLADEEDRFQQDDAYQMRGGRMRLTHAGAPGSQTNQVVSASAWALFVQDRIEWGRVSLVPGVRYETIDLERIDYARTDPARSAPTATLDDTLAVVVPGIGVSLRVSDALDVVAGVHRGFAPPGPGANTATKAEQSVNYEAGLRAHKKGLGAEATVFYNDYDNMLGRDTLASGGTGSGDQFNAGQVRVAGLEASLSYDLREAVGGRLALPVQAAYTLTEADFRNSFQSGFAPWGTVKAGDALPYVPRHQFFGAAGAQGERWQLHLSAHYVGRMRTRAGQGDLVPSESTDSAFVVDALGEWSVTGGGRDGRFRVFAGVQNLTDRRYVVGRHPAGARPGLPRTVTAGVKLRVGG